MNSSSGSGQELPPHIGTLVRSVGLVHAFAKLRAALFEFVDAAAVLAAAEVIGDADDQHDTADEREEVGERKSNRKIFEDIGGQKVGGQMHHRAHAADNGADHHLQPAVRILPCK